LFASKYLKDSLGEVRTNELIEELGGYIASKGDKYKSHYATIKNWAKRKGSNQNIKTKGITII